MICLLFVLSACNVDDGAVLNPGYGDDTGHVDEDSGDLDIGYPDTDGPDSAEPDVDVSAPSCEDGVQNGDETGQDCGGDCAPCALGVGCEEGADCESGFCTGNICVDPSCADVQCDEEEACYRAVCYLSCDDADGCDPNSRCYQGACLPLDCSGVMCGSDETCYRGVCYGACSGDQSCSEEGAECLDGSCVVATCDDGLQNGEESDKDCGGSTCDACAVGKMCEVSEDCQAPIESDFGECEFDDANICALVGSQSRTVIRFTCGDSGTCEAVEEIEIRECTREVGEVQCAEPVTGEWSGCEAIAGEPDCSAHGERRQVSTSYVCRDGGCEAVVDVRVEACERRTEGMSCERGRVEGDWSQCARASDTCDSEGLQSREVNEQRCVGGACETSSFVETRTCHVEIDGLGCGRSFFGEWSGCRIAVSTCSGSESRTRTDRICQGGSCESIESSEIQACYAEAGTSCMGPIPMDTEECVNGIRMVTTWSSQCDGSGGCTPVPHTYPNGRCIPQVCQPGYGCTTPEGTSGCCTSDGMQCRTDVPCLG